MIVIDTHAHIYSQDETVYPMTDNPLRPPEGTGTLFHLRREYEENRVARIVLVHTYTAYRWDNRLLADTVGVNRRWTTGVCTLDPEDEASPRLLALYAASRNVRGCRLYATPGREPVFGHDGHLRLIETAARHGLVVCALVSKENADELAAILSRYPDVPFVLDHCLNLRIGDVETLETVCDLAQYPNLHAKLTFAVTGSNEPYPCRDTHELVQRVIQVYGPERCLWGSDFPCELWCPKATYGEHLRLFTETIPLEPSVRRAVLGETAMRLWFPA